jgi:hypothetical protein
MMWKPGTPKKPVSSGEIHVLRFSNCIAELLTRPAGRHSHKFIVWYKGFLYQAASWKTARRFVAKVELRSGR